MAIPTKDITSKKPEKDWKGCRKNWNMLRTQKNAEMKALIKIQKLINLKNILMGK